VSVDLVQTRFVTDDVDSMTTFYARLVECGVPVNDYYTEVATAVARVAFSRRRFVEPDACGGCGFALPGSAILDFESENVDREHDRIAALGVEWVMPPTNQPWGKRSMMFRDPDGHLVNVFGPIG
jgi:catechol 2,3-dioxygenase-like lactoylglutathione lyase family enzyme